jgi:DNA replication and repair protein RecF
VAVFNRLTLSRFRNFKDTALHFHPAFNVLVGPNGAGKTNVLEGLFFLSIGKSHRNAAGRDFIPFGHGRFALSSEYRTSAGIAKQVSARGTAAGHVFFEGEIRLRSAAALVGRVRIQSFSPDDLLIAAGLPAERRRYMNLLLSQSDINYFLRLREYNRTLLQRNAALKGVAPDPRFLSVLTDRLVAAGAEIREKRYRLIETLAPLAGEYLLRLSKGGEALELALLSGKNHDGQDFRAALLADFRRVEKQEFVLRQTLFGPHRDDLDIRVNQRPARRFASRGQQRSVSLCLKLAAVDFLKTLDPGNVVLLLDDIFSELDDARSALLFSGIRGKCQIFAAMPRRPAFEMDAGRREFTINGGRVDQVYDA